MSASSDWAATRELRHKKSVQVPQKKMLLDVSCTNLDCRHSHMVELDAGTGYPKTVKCSKCGGEAKVTRLR